MSYDSLSDNKKHIDVVRENILEIIHKLYSRAIHHDESKLVEPEKSMYDEYVPKLREMAYGSDEYEQTLKDMGFALEHHFENNRHHPEHFTNGINGMTLVDLIEMLADWKASSSRTGQELNLGANKKRFNISEQLEKILENTVKEMDW